MAKIKRGLVRLQIKLRAKNAEYLPVLLKNRGIGVINFGLISSESCALTIDYADYQKFFAICKNMCYNIISVKYKGILAPFMHIIKSVGVFIGALAFTACSLLLSNVVLKIDVVGSGSTFRSEVVSVLEELGVSKYSLFSSIDYQKVSSQILKSNERLNFVSVEKNGNRLLVKIEASNPPPTILDRQTQNLKSPYSGVVEEIAVLRGTALKNVGDVVTVGDELVGAYVTLKDGSLYETFIIARVKIIAQEKYFHACQNPSEEDVRSALTIAEFLSEGEVLKKSFTLKENGIEVTLSVRYVT